MPLKRIYLSFVRTCRSCFFSVEFWDHVFLVVGTCIGGGITVLPAAMAEQGCFKGLITLTTSSIFSLSSSLLFLELFSNRDSENFFSLFKRKLPSALYFIALCIHSFICFSSIVAYIAGMASELMNIQIPGGYLFGAFLVVLFGVILLGSSRDALMYVNSFLVKALFICFFCLLFYMANLFDCRSITWVRGESVLSSLPICLTSFSHQMIIPSLRVNSQNSFLIKRAIIFGIFLTWLMYVLWVIFSFGSLPLDGPNSLIESYQAGIPMTIPLANTLQMKFFAFLSTCFSLIVLFTSFLGITLSFIDFLRGCFKQPLFHNRSILPFYVLLLASLFAVCIPKVFLYSLNLSGGLGDATLYGLIPVYIALQELKLGSLHLRVLNWQGMLFLIIIGSLSIVTEVSQLFFAS
ncbi:aromatic amino acid transport family protein [Candidatus Similichlamydia epinepheli]|uniref:aromatic amino acid transport family protein n=1 Tax=Candidatus Similichlamydia epinepheli TaxID=1903953 RepID=UPI000D3DBB40|nr:aromatic amino acid transport family protein [Candidatus Similichlamydia epinepheli]